MLPLNRGAAVRWRPPASWIAVRTIDTHAAGEPLRLILAGIPEPSGDTILQRRRSAERELEPLRTALMWEPRGHGDMYGCLVVPPERPGSDFGVLFLHNEGYSTMCGHGIIAATTALLETEALAAEFPETTLRIDTPAGLVTAVASVEPRVDAGGAPAGGVRVPRVRFRNVPSFVARRDAEVEVPEVGRVRYDLAFGGAYYAYVEAADCGLVLEPGDASEVIRVGMAIKNAVAASGPIVDPSDVDLGFLYGTIFVGPPGPSGAHSEPAHSRNACVFAEGELDRSPTGTGVSGRIAIHHARGEVSLNERLAIESILGTRFAVTGLEAVRVGGFDAVVPEVEGRAFLTGRHEFWIDPEDPLASGFFLR